MLTNKCRVIVRNGDNEGLGSWGNDEFFIGYVDEENGEVGIEIPGFILTRHELKLIAKYWVNRALENNYDQFMFNYVCSGKMRELAMAHRRINRIAVLLDPDEFEKVQDEVYFEFAKKVGKRRWDCYLNGDTKQRDKWYAECIERVERRCGDINLNGNE